MTVWIVLLGVLGVALIMTEFFMPGLVMGTLGVISLLASGIMAVIYERDIAIFVIAFEVFGLAMAIAAGMYFMPRTRAGRALILQESSQLGGDWVAAESDTSLVGEVGEAFTTLRPAGTIVVNNKRIGAVTGGDFIEEGTAVRVVEVHGNRVVVERV
ncbi:MAG: NfeD family protein [FCB group bacterium]|nr:NfeD family protein [FCB group bacterium]